MSLKRTYKVAEMIGRSIGRTPQQIEYFEAQCEVTFDDPVPVSAATAREYSELFQRRVKGIVHGGKSDSVPTKGRATTG